MTGQDTNPGTREVLRQMIAQRGFGVLSSPPMVESYLSDLCPNMRRETGLLVSALKAGVPNELLADGASVPPALMRSRLQSRLEADLSITEAAAQWTVESWALALGRLTPAEAATPSALPPSAPAHAPATSTPAPSYPPNHPPSTPSYPPHQAPPVSQYPNNQYPNNQYPNNQYPNNQYPQNQYPQNQGVWPPAINAMDPNAVNISGSGATAVLPPQLRGFNWGALWLSFFWSIANRTWIGLLCLIPYLGWIMAIVLGFKGNEWAWQNRRWDSPEQFKEVQRKWMIWGWIAFVVSFVIGFISALISAHNGNGS